MEIHVRTCCILPLLSKFLKTIIIIVHGFWPETEKFDSDKKRIPCKSLSQREQNGANFSFIAPSNFE